MQPAPTSPTTPSAPPREPSPSPPPPPPPPPPPSPGARAALTYGTGLGAPQLNASSTLPGTFAYTPAAGTILPAGSQTLSVTFTPTDSADYTPATVTATLTVNKATLTLTAANASRPYNTANPTFTGTLSGQVNGDTFTESFATTASLASIAGTYPITPSATGANLANYTVSATPGTLTITAGLPAATASTITWSPAALTYGTGLGAPAQRLLHPPRNLRLHPRRRNHPPRRHPDPFGHLHPDRYRRLHPGHRHRHPHRQKATLTVTAANASRPYNTPNPTFTGTITGAVNGDTFTESFTTTARSASPVGTIRSLRQRPAQTSPTTLS